MRVAVFSDIHGNLPALDAVLPAIRDDQPDAIWYAGDFVGYGPWPEECVQRIAALGVPAVSGNYDEKTLKYPRKAEKWARTKDPRKLSAFRHAYEGLSDGSRDYLAALPQTVRAVFAGFRVLMVHSAPDSARYGISPDTDFTRLGAIAARADADLILTGHTHFPCVLSFDETVFVNAGSAGRPGAGDTRASYALIDLVAGRPIRPEIRHVAYAVEIVIAEVLRTPMLAPEIAELYRTGRASF
jgi:putative phosphoesterase